MAARGDRAGLPNTSDGHACRASATLSKSLMKRGFTFLGSGVAFGLALVLGPTACGSAFTASEDAQATIPVDGTTHDDRRSRLLHERYRRRFRGGQRYGGLG